MLTSLKNVDQYQKCGISKLYNTYTASVIVLGLEVSFRTNFESLALALKVKSSVLRVKSLVNSPGHLRLHVTVSLIALSL